MSQIVLLDSGILGLITAPRASAKAIACSKWIESLADAGDVTLVPEICDYEIRRELLRANKRRGVERLDNVALELGYLPLSTDCMRFAAELWAKARQHGFPTAADAALDGDVILAAQGIVAGAQLGLPVVIATDNVAHLSRYVDARLWENIQPSKPAI
jgi:predicted nucleic acid-binding protein